MSTKSKFKNCFTICIDMDDTIENLLPAWINWLNDEHNLHTSISDVRGWDISELYPSLTAEEIFAPLYDKEFWATVSPKADAVKYIYKLIEDGQDVYICTASHYATIKYKFEAIINKFFPSIDWNKFIVTSNKQMIKCDIMIDDGPQNLINGDYIRVLFDAPHNKDFDEKAYNMKRVHNWEEAYNLIVDLDWFYSISGKTTINY